MKKIKNSHHLIRQRLEAPGHDVSNDDIKYIIQYHGSFLIGDKNRYVFEKQVDDDYRVVVSATTSAGIPIGRVVTAHRC